MGFTPGVGKVSDLSDTFFSNPADSEVLTYDAGKWKNMAGGSTADASTTTKGKIQLAGDLAGTAAAPTVPGLAAKAPLASPTFTGTVTVPTPTNPTDATTKTYVDTQVSSGTADATTSTKGKLQLAGDLAGTAAAPTVAKVNGVTLPGVAPTTGQVLTATSASATNWATPSSSAVTSVAGRTGAVVIAEADVTNLTADLAARALDNTVVHAAGTETIAGAKTFSSPVTVAAPTLAGHAATKNYVDTQSSNVYTIVAADASAARNYTAGAAVPSTWTVIWMCNGSFSPTAALANDIILNTVGN